MAPTAISTPTTGAAWSPDTYTFAPDTVVPDALILTAATVSGDIDGDEPALHVGYVDDSTASFVPEGAEIPESDPQLAEVLVHTAKLSQLVRITNEQFRKAGTAEHVAMSVARSITRAANTAFASQAAPVAAGDPQVTGVLNAAGIVDGGTVTANLDALSDLLATLESDWAQPSLIVASPSAWSDLRKLKAGGVNVNESLLGAGTTDAAKFLLDLPVVVSNGLPAATGLVIDRTAIASAVGAIMVATSQHAAFSSDGVLYRATWRVGWNIVRPERIGKFTTS